MAVAIYSVTACSGLSAGTNFEDLPNLPDQQYVYTFRPQDEIEISVSGDADFRFRVVIGDDGEIDLPYIRTLDAAGKTRSELREEVRARLIGREYYVDPSITINVVRVNLPATIPVLGAVKAPHNVPYHKNINLWEVIAAAGGTSESMGLIRPVLVIRDPLYEPKIYRCDLEDSLHALESGRPMPRLFPGDVVIVQDSAYQDLERALNLAKNIALAGSQPLLGARALDELLQ